MKKVYAISTYELTGAVFYGYRLIGEFREEDIKVVDGKIKKICPNGDTRVDVVIEPNRFRHLSFEPKGVNKETEKLLPYFADVTEDISGAYNFKPRTYKDCQLMVETRGNNNYFWNEREQKKLLIAINSNYYTPITNKVI